jgi:uncharacterized protein (DUF342 family)
VDGFQSLEPERKPKLCWVRATDAEAALAGAAELLAREVAELEILSSKSGQFRVGVRFLDVSLRFGLSADEMQVVLLAVESENQARAPVVATVTRQLGLAGVRFGIDETAVQACLDGLLAGGVDSRIVLAQGMEAQPKREGGLEAIGGIQGAVVFPGEAFASFIEERGAQAGSTVLGKIIPAPEGGQPFDLDLADGCVLDGVASRITSLVYGRPWIEGGRVGVRSLLTVSEDKMSAHLEIGAHRLDGKPVSVVDLQGALEGAGIAPERMNADAIRGAVKAAWEGENNPSVVCVAQGLPAQSGREEWMEIQSPAAGMFFEGDVVLRVYPAIEPVLGMTVLGRELASPTPEKEVSFELEAGLSCSPGATEILAESPGRLVQKGMTLSWNRAVSIVPDGLSCLVDVPPVDAQGAPVSVSFLRGWLDRAGVLSECVDGLALERAIQLTLKKQEVIADCMLAVGTPPQSAWEPEYKPLPASTRTGAYPGDVLVEIETPEPAQPGRTVIGQPIPPPKSDSDSAAFHIGEGCEEQGGVIVATRYGRVVFGKKKVSVESALRVDERGESAHLSVYVKRIGGLAVDETQLLAFLEQAGLHSRCLNLPLLKKALASNKSREILVASAIAPVSPQDAQFCSAVARSIFPVFPGDRVAWVEPSVPGEPGLNVRGKVLEAEGAAAEVRLVADTFCVLSEDKQAVDAQAYGLLHIEELDPEDGVRVFQIHCAPAIRVDAEKHHCHMDVFGEKIDGSLVGIEELALVLCDSGLVDRAIDRKAIGSALAVPGSPVQHNVLVASGKKPSSGSGWVVRPLLEDPLAVVFPGESIAEVFAKAPGSDGWDLEGKAIEMESGEFGLALHPRVHCRLSEDGKQVVSTAYGRAQVEGLRIRVVPGFRVGLSDFTLRMDIFPHRSGGAQISEKDLLEQLKYLEIPDELLQRDVIADALEKAWVSQQTQWHVQVAKGVLPTKGKNGQVEAVGDHARGCVFPGELVACLVPEVQPNPGQTVFGGVIPVTGVVRAAKVFPEEGCQLQNETELVATRYGRPFLDGKKVMVVSSLYPSTDGMRMAMDLFCTHSNGDSVEVDQILELLRNQGVVEEFIGEESLASGLVEAEKRGGTFWDFEVAIGRLAVLGKDGRAEKTGTREGCVFPDEPFARFHPHTPGVPGLTVKGRSVPPAEEPQLVRLLQGPGAKISPDGLLALAEQYGVPILDKALASVESSFRVSDDDMAVFMDIWSHRVSGDAVSVDAIRDFLVAAGIEPSCIDEKGLGEALEKAGETQAVQREVCVAKGLSAVEGQDGQALFSEQLHCSCVFPGEVFGRLVLPKLPQVGVTVRGKKINPTQGVREIKFATKEGVVFDPETLTLTAEKYGHIEVKQGRVTEGRGGAVSATEQVELTLVEGVLFSESRLACRMNVFPQRLDGSAVELTDLKGVLEAAGVKAERILERVLGGVRKAAARQIKAQMGIIVAKGIMPRHGADGELELITRHKGQAGERGAFGRIDFKEQNSFVEVQSGLALATLSTPSEGQAGETVSGEALDARDGKDGSLELGPGVEIRDGQVVALREGVLAVRGNFIDVVELLVIEGDVDYRSGNVKVQTGSVRITGSVLPGFEVICPEDVEVGEVVEGAKIIAGGNVVVRGGVVSGGDQDCSIEAGGEISVGLARNVTLKAKADIVVQKELFHCNVSCEGKLMVDRKPGVVSGGTLVARKGASVCQLGSAQWTPTILRVGGTGQRVTAIQKDLGGLRRQRLRLNDRLGGQTDTEILSRCSPSERPKIESLCAQREAVRAEIGELEQDLASRLAAFESEPQAILVVKESLFPRVVLNFPQGQWVAEVQVNRARFFFDTQDTHVKHLDIGTALPDFLGYFEEES